MAAPSQELAQRIFSRTDWNFVAQESVPIKRLYIRERRNLALQWLHRTRRQAALINHCRRAYVPSQSQRPMDRLRHLSNYAIFQSLCAALFLLIRWGNPIYAAKLAARAVVRVERLSEDIPHLN